MLREFRRQAARERRDVADVVLDFDALASVLAADRAIDLEASLASAFDAQVGEVDGTRWGR